MRASPQNFPSKSSGPKRTRKVGLKSHGGCKVCKKRHLKCDEAQPVCKRCMVSGWSCEYEMQPVHLSKHPILPYVGSFQSQPSTILHSPSTDIQGTSQERRSFHYFRSRNVATVPGNFEPYLWNHLVLQMSHKYPTIQQSLFALSAMYEEHSHSPGAVFTRSSYSADTLKQYGIAIKGLVHYLSSPDPDPRAALVSCLIFVWIEFLQNRTDLAFGQVRSGLKIMRELPDGTKYDRKDWFLSDTEDLYGSLNRSFTRLEIQAAIHGTPVRDSNSTILDRIATMEPIPAWFANVNESRNCLDGEINAIYTFVREAQNVTTAASSEQAIAFDARQNLLKRLDSWKSANSKVPENMGNSSAIAYLEMYYTAAKITLEVLFTTSEMVYDNFTAEFETILQMASRLVKPSVDASPVLSFDMGVVPPLSFMVMKCRVLRLRRKAISLLRMAPGQEGLWCRETMLKYCEWKVTLEEQGRGNLSEEEFLPESARVPVPYPQGIRTVGEADFNEILGVMDLTTSEMPNTSQSPATILSFEQQEEYIMGTHKWVMKMARDTED